MLDQLNESLGDGPWLLIDQEAVNFIIDDISYRWDVAAHNRFAERPCLGENPSEALLRRRHAEDVTRRQCICLGLQVHGSEAHDPAIHVAEDTFRASNGGAGEHESRLRRTPPDKRSRFQQRHEALVSEMLTEKQDDWSIEAVLITKPHRISAGRKDWTDAGHADIFSVSAERDERSLLRWCEGDQSISPPVELEIDAMATAAPTGMVERREHKRAIRPTGGVGRGQRQGLPADPDAMNDVRSASPGLEHPTHRARQPPRCTTRGSVICDDCWHRSGAVCHRRAEAVNWDGVDLVVARHRRRAQRGAE
jgi:hypothetical protein